MIELYPPMQTIHAKGVAGASMPPSRKLFSILVAAFGLTNATVNAASAGSYTIKELPPPANQSYPYDIDNRGDVVGEAVTDDGSRGYVYDGNTGRVTLLGPGIVTAINDRGDYTGISYLGGSIAAYVEREDGGVFLNYSHDCGPSKTYAWDINASGTAVGYYYACLSPSVSTWRGFRLIGDTPQDLNDTADLGSEALAINDLGHAVGYFREFEYEFQTEEPVRRAALFSGNAPQKIYSANVESAATDINNNGWIVGWWQELSFGDFVEPRPHAFLHSNGGNRTLFDGIANAINNNGQVVGSKDTSGSQKAVRWQNGQLEILDNLLPIDSGWELQSADAINDRGEIAGYGLHNGELRAFVMTPLFPDLLAVDIVRNRTSGGIEVRYQVINGELSVATTAKLFWARGTDVATDILSTTSIVPPQTIPVGTGSPTTSGIITFNVPASALASPAPSSTHILLVLDYEPPSTDGLVHESDESNNSVALELCVSPITAEQLRSYLTWHNKQNPVPEAQNFRNLPDLQLLISESVAAGWDPRFILGIAGAETTFGRNLDANGVQQSLKGNFNFWNLKDTSGAWMSFNSWEEAVREAAQRPSQPAYQGRKTIDGIAPIYTSTAVESWIEAVKGTMCRLGYFPNGTEVTCSEGAEHPFSGKSACVTVESPISLYMIDPFGRRYGQSCEGQTFYREIPLAVTDERNGRLKGIWLPTFVDGTYTVVLCGIGTGKYSLTSSFSHPPGGFSGIATNGQISNAEVQAFAAQVTSDNLEATIVNQLATYVHMTVSTLEGTTNGHWIRWSGVPLGHITRVEFSSIINPVNWMDISGPLSRNSWTNTITEKTGNGFYRLRIE